MKKKLGRRLWWRLCGWGLHGRGAQGAGGDTAQDPALPQGQAETRRTQESKDVPAAVRPHP